MRKNAKKKNEKNTWKYAEKGRKKDRQKNM